MSKENQEKLALLARKKAKSFLVSSGSDLSSISVPTDNTLNVLGGTGTLSGREREMKIKQSLLDQQELFRVDKEKSKLPEDWKALLEEASGKIYYWNRRTNETRWDRPSSSPSSSSGEEVKVSEGGEVELPEGEIIEVFV